MKFSHILNINLHGLNTNSRMGITKLADLIRSNAPAAISYKEIGDYAGTFSHLANNCISFTYTIVP